jgi:hypothetical protein
MLLVLKGDITGRTRRIFDVHSVKDKLARPDVDDLNRHFCLPIGRLVEAAAAAAGDGTGTEPADPGHYRIGCTFVC